MWIRKTEEEMEAVRHHKQHSPRIPLLLAAFTTAVAPLMTHSFSVPFAIGLFVAVFLITHVSQVLSEGRFWLIFLGDLAVVPNKGSVICVDCHAVQHDAPQCTKCGGALDEFALWSW